MQIGILGGTGPAGSALGARLASVGFDVVIGSRSETRASEVVAGLRDRWPAHDLALTGAENATAAGADVVVIATPWDGAHGTATSVAGSLEGKVVICMANALVRIGKEFQPLVPPRGSVAASVQAAVPGCRVAAGFHHVPAKELGDLDHPIESDVLICSDFPDATATTADLVARVPDLRPLDAGGLSQATPIESFTAAIDLAPPSEREPERLSLAGALVELGRTEEAVQILSEVEDDNLRPEELSVHRYLLGRSHLELGNPNLALELLTQAAPADRAEPDDRGEAAHASTGSGSYSVDFATAQALSALRRYPEALIAYQWALAKAPAEHRAYTQHEAAYAMIECDKLLQADEMLNEVVSDPSYPHRPDALADLADVRLRSGEFEAAQVVAEQALELGATAPACLTLGNIAYEYYRLEEATSWFEQAISASQAGDPYWVSAHQLLADVYAQLGDEYAARTLMHARSALEYTEPTSEWHLPLTQYVDEAKRRLGGFDRLLN